MPRRHKRFDRAPENWNNWAQGKAESGLPRSDYIRFDQACIDYCADNSRL